ncbi:MAG: hypothetical protein LBH18_00665 [Spirochaetaceae bacterium]|nr:hypothetical protein [Spirochaetaceae bacterium]
MSCRKYLECPLSAPVEESLVDCFASLAMTVERASRKAAPAIRAIRSIRVVRG